MREGRREERETICEETAIIHITKPVIRERQRERGALVAPQRRRRRPVRSSPGADIPRLRVTLAAAQYGDDGILKLLEEELLTHRETFLRDSVSLLLG